MIQESVIEFKLPALGENIEQGDLVRLMIAPGATVSEGQAVMELETDKAVVEVPSSVSGKVKEILVKEGEKIKVGQVIFTLDNHNVAAVAVVAANPSCACSFRANVHLLRIVHLPNQQRLQNRCRLPRRKRRLRLRHRETGRPMPRRPGNSGCRNWAKTFRKVIWCA